MPGTKGNSGGQRPNQTGRPGKVEEKKISSFAIKSMIKVFGSEQKAWDKLGEESKDSFPHRKLLMEYAYGKPKEIKEIDIDAVIRIVDDTDEEIETDQGAA